eukprot:gb/GFBE01062148.1/.p1 GENE.gb/GFBE01062148.1/~~gb/GFBE01062148.1/.p1  ORF type:complete len:110 (+),score=14.98 gb/GFBE01062148.1/:1-330(+)
MQPHVATMSTTFKVVWKFHLSVGHWYFGDLRSSCTRSSLPLRSRGMRCQCGSRRLMADHLACASQPCGIQGLYDSGADFDYAAAEFNGRDEACHSGVAQGTSSRPVADY